LASHVDFNENNDKSDKKFGGWVNLGFSLALLSAMIYNVMDWAGDRRPYMKSVKIPFAEID